MVPPEPADRNLFLTEEAELAGLQKLPENLEQARLAAENDPFIRAFVPEKIREIYCSK